MKFRHTLQQFCVPLLIGGTVLSLIVISACHSISSGTAVSVGANAPPVFAMRIVGDRSMFDLPTTATETPRADLLRLVDVLDEAYDRLNFEAPFPRIRVVDPHHPRLHGRAVGVAAVTVTGESRIYLNRQYLSTRAHLLPLVLHELAHLKAWRRHGLEIETHGPEFMQICRAVTARRNCTAKEG